MLSSKIVNNSKELIEFYKNLDKRKVKRYLYYVNQEKGHILAVVPVYINTLGRSYARFPVSLVKDFFQDKKDVMVEFLNVNEEGVLTTVGKEIMRVWEVFDNFLYIAKEGKEAIKFYEILKKISSKFLYKNKRPYKWCLVKINIGKDVSKKKEINLKKGFLNTIIVTIVFIFITLLVFYWLYNSYYKPYTQKIKSNLKENVKNLDRNIIDILTQEINSPRYYDSIHYVQSLFPNYKYEIYNIQNYKGLSPIIFGFLPLNNQEDINKLKEIFKYKKDSLFIFFFSFLLGSPDGKCILPAQQFIKNYFDTYYVKGVKDLNFCIQGYYGYVKVNKLYVYNPELKSYTIENLSGVYLKMSFFKKSKELENPIGIEYKGHFYPLVIDKGDKIIITYKLGLSKKVDKYTISYISRKIETFKRLTSRT